MINIFNRKELFITYSLEKYIDITKKLQSSNIDYTVVTKNISSAGRSYGRINSLSNIGEDTSASTEYKIYVHKKDFENGIQAINH